MGVREIKTFLLILLLVLLCNIVLIASPYEVEKKYDEIEGFTRYKLYGNYLAGTGLIYTTLDIGLVKIEPLDGSNSFFAICVTYVSTDCYIFVKYGTSLIFLIDGERIFFNCETTPSSKYTHVDGLVTFYIESAAYPLTRDQIKKIIDGKDIKIKLKGEKKDITGYLDEETLVNFRRFYTEHLEKRKPIFLGP